MNRFLRALTGWRPPIWLIAIGATALLVGVVAFPGAVIEFLVTIVQLAILAVAFVICFQVARWLLNRGGTTAASAQQTQVITQQPPTTSDPDQTRVMPNDQQQPRRRP
jgi:hypothetical protein